MWKPRQPQFYGGKGLGRSRKPDRKGVEIAQRWWLSATDVFKTQHLGNF